MAMQTVTWDSITKGTLVTLSNNDLTAYFSNSRSNVRSSIGRTNGKYYIEFTLGATSNGYLSIGICPTINYSNSEFISTRSECIIYNGGSGNIAVSSTIKATVSKFTTGDIVSVLLYLDSGTIEYWKNGVSQVFVSGIDNTKEWVIVSGYESTNNNGTITANFGATPFAYNIPRDYYSYDGSQGGASRYLIELSDDRIVSLTDQYLRSVKLISYSASSTYPGYQISSLFDGITTNNWTANGRISIIYTESESPFVLNSYEMFVVTTYTSRMPRDWDVYGSNDNQNWTIVDSRRSVTTWTSNESNIFNIKTTIPYKYYKFDISANNGDVYLTMAELVLYEKIDEQMVLLESKSEDIFLKNGIGISAEINLQKYLNTKVFNKHSFDILGSGKVFKQKIDTTKTLIKKASIT